MKMDVSGAVIPLVEAMLPRFSDKNLFLYIPVGASVACYSVDGRDTDVSVYRDIHFLFHRPHNYTKVFLAVSGWARVYEKAPEDRFGKWVWEKREGDERFYNMNQHDWYMTSDHDSCWRSDGVSSPLWELRMSMEEQLSVDASAIVGRSVGRLSGPNASWHVSLDPIGGRICYFTGEVVLDDVRNAIRGSGSTHMKLPKNLEKVEDARKD